MSRTFVASVILLLTMVCPTLAADGNRLAYLDGPLDPYYPHRDFPKLITPQWVGEEGVECVVTLAIDDMRESAKYEAFLRPILDRLKKMAQNVFKTEPVIPRLRPRMLKMLAWTDIPHRLWYTWRAPAWIYLLDLILVAQALRFRRWVWLLPGAVPLAQQLNVLVLNPSQDARYMFGAYMVAMASLPVLLLSRLPSAAPPQRIGGCAAGKINRLRWHRRRTSAAEPHEVAELDRPTPE